MRRTRISIAGLMAVVAVSAVVLASFRAQSGVGANLISALALALNFAAVAIIPTALGPRVRLGALGYAIGGWGWMVAVALIREIDASLRDAVVIPAVIRLAAPGANPAGLILSPFIARLLFLVHSLCIVAAGTAVGMLGWMLGARLDDPESSTTQTTGPS